MRRVYETDLKSESCVLAYDWRLFEIEAQMNILSYLNPVNSGREKARFLKAYAAGKHYDPVFEYESPGPEVAGLCRELKRIKGRLELCKNSVFAPYYVRKIDYLLYSHALLMRRDSPGFGAELAAFHGSPSEFLLAEARKNLKSLKTPEEEEENLEPDAVRKLFQEEIRRFGLEWEIRPTGGGGAKIAVSAARSEIYINFSTFFSGSGVKRYLCHEIGTHVFRAENGKCQPLRLFLSGFPGYTETEEGLAVYNEARCELLDPQTLKKYSARVVAAAMCSEASFSGIFEELVCYFPPEKAFTHARRVKRGLIDTSLPGGYTKDYVYLSGFQKVSTFLQNQPSEPEALKILYCGKIGLKQFELARNLLERGVLKQPRYLSEMQLPSPASRPAFL